MRLGVDLGGTKIEIIALGEDGAEMLRRRVPTPRGSYAGIVGALVDIVNGAEAELARMGHAGPHSVGIGMPGAIGPDDLAFNCNSTELNGEPLQRDLSARLGREVRMANDANCLAVSEAADGAGAGKRLVHAVIIGTGVGSGIAIDGRSWDGLHRVAGEFGHNPLPWPTLHEVQTARDCFCGNRGCIETWVAGPSFERLYRDDSGRALTAPQIVAEAVAGEAAASAALAQYVSRLGRALAHVVNLLDPDVIVLGGGMSKVALLYDALPGAIAKHAVVRRFSTPILPAKHGDSSGVRGAAWLWGQRPA